MDLSSWLLFAAATLAALAASLFVYYMRESASPERRLPLALLRGGVLGLILLLLFDPQLPRLGAAASAARARVLLDASLSMALPSEPADSRWTTAAAEAAALAGGEGVVLFGERARVVPADSLPALEPSETRSLLLPALRAAAEAGARRVLVLTDAGLEDPAAAGRAAAELGLGLELRRVGEPVANRALAEVEAPSWAEAGQPIELRYGVVATEADADSVRVVVRRDGRVLATDRQAVPAPGRVAAGVLRFTPDAPARGGLVRFDLAIEPGDAVPADDARSVYVHVSEQPAPVVLVSFRPDWEPRFLLPVLERALGLPVLGYLRTDAGRYVRLGTGLEAGRALSEERVRSAVADAELLVVHGLGPEAPEWAAQAAARASRLLAFPSGAGEGLPLSVPPPVAGDWYPVADLPPSPVAPVLSGVSAADAPPLAALRPADPPAGTWAPLVASLGRRGARAPVALAGESGGRRWVVALGEGYWRWAFRGGEAAQLYRRLWGALGGWLVRDEAGPALAQLRPLDRSTPRGERLRWVASGLAAERLALRITDAAGEAVRDTVLPLIGDTASLPALPPGHYRYAARALAEGREIARAEGPLTQEAYSPEFARAAAELTAAEADLEIGEGRGGPPGRPLHTTPWPYLAILGLLSTEWILRRRWGLR